ncbi:MAG: hypothetical protein OEV74_11715 [Cyclobacteriaceae bacterium]|nr:hypothetical protein [Cyclobacteriaceae bacterium]MDH4296942.1 hypothetical protein [Cyclobacteriaceae bacterium]MDH5250804.1 hypothetical protein [Cyclobacteriaceae bacterium]
MEKYEQLFLKEFPEFSIEIDQLLNYEDFLDMLRDFAYCDTILSKLNDLADKKEAYDQLKKELKQEMKVFIIRHIAIRSIPEKD